MPEDQFLTRVAQASWKNFHGTVQVPIRAMWKIRNPSSTSSMAGMRATAQRIQRLINHAVDQQIRLRPVGSRWSFSEVAAPRDCWGLDTTQLNYDFTLGSGSVAPDFDGQPAELVLAQAGASVAEINLKIEAKDRRRSLTTSGASNGQTVAGVIGTGVHGSAVDEGAMQSQVAGLQLLTAERNMWLEHPDRPTVNEAFAGRLGAELVRDALLFEAALVSLGSLGVVHSVLLRTSERYNLRSALRKIPLSQVEHAMNTLDFTGVPLPSPHKRPYFFQVVVNPNLGEEMTRVTVRYKEECPADHVPQPGFETGYEAGNDLPGIFGKMAQTIPPLTPALVRLLISQELKPFEDKVGTPAETYSYTTSRPGSCGAALGIPAALTSSAIAIARQVFAENPWAPAILACRFAQASPGLLSFTPYHPTCIIDIDGVDTPATRNVMEKIRVAFDQEGIPYAQHWGKLHGLTAARVRRSFGPKIEAWNHARAVLLPTAEQRFVFSTGLLETLGLNQ